MPDYALYRSPVKKNPERWRIDEMLPPAAAKNTDQLTGADK